NRQTFSIGGADNVFVAVPVFTVGQITFQNNLGPPNNTNFGVGSITNNVVVRNMDQAGNPAVLTLNRSFNATAQGNPAGLNVNDFSFGTVQLAPGNYRVDARYTFTGNATTNGANNSANNSAVTIEMRPTANTRYGYRSYLTPY